MALYSSKNGLRASKTSHISEELKKKYACKSIHWIWYDIKKVAGQNYRVQTKLPELDEEGSILLQPTTVLKIRECQLRQHIIKEVLVQWKNTSPEDAT